MANKKNKTLFNSTEESNFILNMTEEKYDSLASKVIIICCIIGSVFTIPYELSNNKFGFSIVEGGLAVCGVMAMIFALIAALKNYITKKMLFPLCSFGFFAVWSVISAFNAYDFRTAFYGTDGRGEGVLATVFYFCIFVTAMTIKGKKKFHLISDAVVITGSLNAFWALIQLFVKDFRNFYRSVPLTT